MSQSTPQQKKKAMLQMLLCASLWSLAGIFLKQIPWNPMAITGLRGLIAAAAVGLWLVLTRTPIRISFRGLLGGLFMSLTAFFFVIANKLTTAANAIVLQFTSPIFILLFCFLFFRQKFSRGDLLAVFLTSFGVALFFFDRLAAGHLLGNIIAIAGGATEAAMLIVLGRCDFNERLGGMLGGHFISTLVGLPFFLAAPPEITAPAMGSILVLGILQTALPYILFVKAEEHCSALAINLLGVVEPILNPVWVFVFDGEAPGLFALLGAAVVIVTVTVWSSHQTRPDPGE